MFNVVIRTMCTALVLSLAACGGGGGGGGTTTPPANNVPVITEGATTSVIMSVNSTPTAFNLVLHASDADNDTLTWSLGSVVTAQHASSVSVSGTGASPTVSYTPTTDYVGADSFDVQVSDGKGGTATITVNVTVGNAAPVITQGASVAVIMSENSSPNAFNVALDATDANGDTLTWSLGTVVTAQHASSVSVSGTGASPTVNYMPTLGYVGTDSFDVQVSDGKGGTATITVNVNITNTAPVITQGTSTNVSMSVNSTPTAFSVTIDATDANGDTLTWSLGTVVIAQHASSVSVSGTGASPTVSYTPTTDYVGNDSFDVTVSDGHTGGTATITVNVTVSNDKPVILLGSPTSVSMSENGNPIPFSVTIDATDANGDTLTWSLGTVVTAQHASSVSVSGTGASPTVSYTPTTDYVGTDSFDVTVSDGHVGGTATITVNVTVLTTNTMTISVDGYASYNRPFVSVTICEPGTSTCQTIDHIVIDTGAVGLRILASEVTGVTLLPYSGAASYPIGECYPLIGGFVWGSLKSADVKLGGELAGNVPIQIINNTDAGVVPSGCSSVGTDIGSLGTTGIKAKGILGLQYFASDCGASCETASNNLYYTCTTPSNATTCSTIGVLSADQVPNPVSKFGLNGSGVADNNGVTISLPALSSAGAVSATGTLTFGVGTQPNNSLNGSATVMTAHSPTGFLPTDFDGKTLCNSMIDSGSNNFNFPQGTTGLPLCTSLGNGNFYCPTTDPTPLPATIKGLNGLSKTFNFDVANTDNLLSTNNAFNDIAANLGTLFVGTYTGCTGTTVTDGSFIWGLPFFFGRNVTFVIDGNTNMVDSTLGPYVAF